MKRKRNYKKKRIISIALACLTLVSILVTTYHFRSVIKTWIQDKDTDVSELPIIDGNPGDSCEGLPKNIVFQTANPEKTVTINVTVLPEDATNTTVNWSLEWVAETENVMEDYITMEVLNNTHTINLKLKQPFDIAINVVAKTEEITQKCKLDFLKAATIGEFFLGIYMKSDVPLTDSKNDYLDFSSSADFKFVFNENTLTTCNNCADPLVFVNVKDERIKKYWEERNFRDDYYVGLDTTFVGTIGTVDYTATLDFSDFAKEKLKPCGINTTIPQSLILNEIQQPLSSLMIECLGEETTISQINEIANVLASFDEYDEMFLFKITYVTTYESITRTQTLNMAALSCARNYIPTSEIIFDNGNGMTVV